MTQKEYKKRMEEEFGKVSDAILKFMNSPLCHPHMTIVADCNHVELLEGKVSAVVNKKEDNDE